MTEYQTSIEATQPDRPTMIRRLNDTLRRTGQGGRVVITAGVAGLPQSTQAAVLAVVRGFGSFNAGNDPHGEHDFGSVEVAGAQVLWKVDAYDLDGQFASPDPSDEAVTRRVLTIMLAEEY